LYDPMTIMFFFRNKLIMVDLGSGNNNKLNFVLEDKQELIDIIETVYRGAKKGRGLPLHISLIQIVRSTVKLGSIASCPTGRIAAQPSKTQGKYRTRSC
jgi:hypothetical protein